MKQTIEQMFKKYGFKNISGGFHRVYRNGFTIIKCAEELKRKDSKMINKYIQNNKIRIISKDREGKDVDYFIGFWQNIQHFRKKEMQRYCPSQLHQKEMFKYVNGDLLNF